ncbi:UDP-N-acetylenolpyruvoylglucosamine reductase [Frischella perrara]|uniref:UDP-N-acetylenolpyruvoylglucosamine reductase n=1 Tax=Frischella perrara TaxID=1267021 RepID=A0A318MXV6_FRIPE|nr:UDP-N-acetylmuramate dehydrogenase [Frischella perrara]PXY95873.1 UDP-N-acetylenolpyruvoylglucosamine reductase [Frischella perrara]
MNYPIPNTFRLPVYAKSVTTVTSIEQLLASYHEAQAKGLPILVLGQGSNTLFTENFAGMVIINRITGITVNETPDAWFLSVGAGEIWHQLVKLTIEQGMPGLENLALIPGCVGSAAIQNIGAYGVEFKNVADYVDLLELDSGHIIRVTDGEYGYRNSIFKSRYLKGYVVVKVGIKLAKQWQPIINYGELAQFDPNAVNAKLIFDKVCAIRLAKLPNPEILGNGGSFFKNPVVSQLQAEVLLQQYPNMPYYPQSNGQVKLAAGWLIDQCGLKGYQLGGAAVHDKQALVLVNKQYATAQDVINLARFIKHAVQQKFDVILSPEIRFIGATAEINADQLLSQ